mgnify:CR=1 FL=1
MNSQSAKSKHSHARVFKENQKQGHHHYCETEPSSSNTMGKKGKQKSQKKQLKVASIDRQLQILKEDDFEKVIEYTESDEEAEVRANAATIGLLDDDN